MSAPGCCRAEVPPSRLSDRQRRARTAVGLAALGVALRAHHRSGASGAVGAVSAGWFGISHLVAAQTGYAGCPELGAIASLLLRRDVPIGCAPWRIADRRLGLTM